jgi:hypothetical protein
MFVRSSKYLQALVDRDEALTTANRALTEARRMKLERDQLRRELQESKDDYLHRLLFRRVAVNLHAPEMTVEGVLAAVYNDSIVVRHATTVIGTGATEQLVGDQVIPQSQIGWVTDLSGAVRS